MFDKLDKLDKIIRLIPFICILGICFYGVIYIITNDNREIHNKNIEVEDKNLSKLIYFEDPRTGICFAYVWTGAGWGGGTITAVNCNAVNKILSKVPKFWSSDLR